MLRVFLAALTVAVFAAGTAEAQISSASQRFQGSGVASLDDILINSLHATNVDQQIFIKRAVHETKVNRLETRLVLAVMYYAQRQNPTFPFPYFEQILRHEAAKKGVHLPAVMTITSSRIPRRR